MSKAHWKERYAAGGVCDFRENYDFFFKWLLGKVSSCFVIDGLPDTVNQTYLKSELILQGAVCVTEFGGKLYACTGNLGGKPDEYYIPTKWIIANPVLGSKQVELAGDNPGGVVIWNSAIDELYNGAFECGLYQHINQTATLLADNIISINANQINSRVVAMVEAESDAQAVTAEGHLKMMYAGRPYVVLRSDIVEKIKVNPIATATTSANITELVELHNYIISNFMQSIGIRANNVRKKERLITDEIDAQDDYLQVSILEILASWQKGFDKVNDLYGTEIRVTLSPAIRDLLLEPEAAPEGQPAEEPEQVEPEAAPAGDDPEEPESGAAPEPEPEETPETVAEELAEESEIIEEIAEAAAGEGEQDETVESGYGAEVASNTVSERENDA